MTIDWQRVSAGTQKVPRSTNQEASIIDRSREAVGSLQLESNTNRVQERTDLFVKKWGEVVLFLPVKRANILILVRKYLWWSAWT